MEVSTVLEFLADIPLYQEEKPYYVLPLEGSDIDPDTDKVTNIQLESKAVLISDVRGKSFHIMQNGFQIEEHYSEHLRVEDLNNMNAYMRETDKFLATVFPEAELVITWEFRARENKVMARDNFDANDPMLVEGPAKGAHVDATVDSGPSIIDHHLPLVLKDKYYSGGYRFRLINTWRSLVPDLQDRPLAFCDFASIDPQNLVPADRVYPHRLGEVYYLQHNPAQKWYWLSNMSPHELLVTIMYDSTAGKHARYCPHVSFPNPLAEEGAPHRRSIETRSIVISKIDAGMNEL